MKTFVLYIVLLLLSVQLIAQQNNLVPNPSFEEKDSCPKGISGIDKYCRYWFTPWMATLIATIPNAFGSSDYFHACDSTFVSTPNNLLGFQYPKTGIAYAGIITSIYYTYGNYYSWDVREYLEIKLIEKLKPGKEYCGEFFYSYACTTHFDINKWMYLGMYFSDDTVKRNEIPINFIAFEPILLSPQIDHPIHPVYDTTNWIKFSGSFIAQGGEEFLTIGSFSNHHPTNVMNYIFIDDVSVWYCGPDTTSAAPEPLIPNVFTPNGDGFNDRFEITHAEYWDLYQIIYNRWGQILFESRDGSFWDGTYRGNPCAEGAYFYKIIARHPETGEENEYTGSVTLYR